ncbi:acyltransferase [Sphingopyxis sp.]|uniref:acyltransferase family protein n=1 Tax=Sphingopyxis sp. TaxID=1908224 RepID=UPI0025FA4564|nr:acyltransferase [Sphingopyxis sp.]MBK6414307.1 acyltransferase [Sphingopyxis sp.]
MTGNEQSNSTVTPHGTIAKNGTMHSIQLLRAIAALLVVLYHGQLAISTRFATPAFAVETYLFAFGAVGVHIFFVISGFIMVYTTHVDPSFVARDFLRKRIFRIYPMYWVCVGLYLVAHNFIGSPYQLSGSEILGALALYPEHASAIIGPAWTLSFEMFFYLCFGIAMKLGATRGLVILGAVFMLSIATGFFFPIEGALGRLITNSLLLEFIAGAAIGWLLATGRLPRRGGSVVLLLAISLFGAGIAFGYDRFPSVAMWGIPSTLLVAGAVIWENSLGFKKELRKFSHFGNSSYVLYLIHLIVITLTITLAAHVPAIKMVEPALAALAIAGLSLLVAEGLHAWIERPMTRWLNRLFGPPLDERRRRS